MEIEFKFFEQKKLLAYEEHEYTLSENTRLQAWVCPEQSFYDVAKTKYD